MTRRRAPEDRQPVIVARVFAAVRLCCMSLIALVAFVGDGWPGVGIRTFAVVALGIAYALGLATLAVWRPELVLRWKRLTAIDFALAAALSLCGLGAVVLAVAYPLLPVLIALVARPLTTFLVSLAPIMILVVYALTYPSAGNGQELTTWALFSVGFVIPAVIGAAFSAVRQHLDRAAVENARREVLAATIVRVEAHERHELADALHDGPVQHLAAAYREVTSSLQGGRGSLEDARVLLGAALEQLRGEIFDLYPHVLDHAGLQAAVSELVRRAQERGGFTTSVHIDPSAVGIDDVTVMAVLRELLDECGEARRSWSRRRPGVEPGRLVPPRRGARRRCRLRSATAGAGSAGAPLRPAFHG